MTTWRTTTPDGLTVVVENPSSIDKFIHSGGLRCFISYRDGHEKGAIQLAEMLTKFGFETFVGYRDLPYCAKWDIVIQRVLIACDVFVAYATPGFGEGVGTTREVKTAASFDKPIFPVFTGEIPSGPVAEYQGLKINTLSEAIDPIVRTFSGFPRMTESLVCAIERCARDGSFDLANRLARAFEYILYMTGEQADRLIKVYNRKSLANRYGNTNQIRAATAFAPSDSSPRQSIITRKINELTTRSVSHASNGDICSVPPTIPVLTRTAPVRPAFTHEVDEIRDEPPWYNSELARRELARTWN